MITVSKVTKEELNLIKDLAYKIWPDTYKSFLSAAQITYMLQKFYSIDSLKSQVVDKNHIFIMASQNNINLGFASYELNCSNENKGVKKAKLHKLYILPEAQKKGLGILLLKEVEKRVKNANCDCLFLNVNRKNKAQEFYKKYGFQIAKEENRDIGNGFFMNDYVMEKIL
jgi:ribosomal protein S18 acetylase RimI-like enzyme